MTQTEKQLQASFIFGIIAAIAIPIGVAATIKKSLPWLQSWHVIAYILLVCIGGMIAYWHAPRENEYTSKQ